MVDFMNSRKPMMALLKDLDCFAFANVLGMDLGGGLDHPVFVG